MKSPELGALGIDRDMLAVCEGYLGFALCLGAQRGTRPGKFTEGLGVGERTAAGSMSIMNITDSTFRRLWETHSMK